MHLERLVSVLKMNKPTRQTGANKPRCVRCQGVDPDTALAGHSLQQTNPAPDQQPTPRTMHYSDRAIAAPRAARASSTFMSLQCQDYFLCLCVWETENTEGCNSHTLIRPIPLRCLSLRRLLLPSPHSSVNHTHLSPLMCHIILHREYLCLHLSPFFSPSHTNTVNAPSLYLSLFKALSFFFLPLSRVCTPFLSLHSHQSETEIQIVETWFLNVLLFSSLSV